MRALRWRVEEFGVVGGVGGGGGGSTGSLSAGGRILRTIVGRYTSQNLTMH